MNYNRLLIQFIILISGFLIFLFLFRDTPDASLLKREAFWAEKLEIEQKYDIVFVGDSRVYRGISPYPFDSLGIRMYNFGFSACAVVHSVVEKALNKLDCSGSKAIVLAYNPRGFTDDFSTQSFDEYNSLSPTDLKIKTLVYPLLYKFDRIAVSELKDLFGFKSKGVTEYFLDNGWVAVSAKAPEGDIREIVKRHAYQLEGAEIKADRIRNFVSIGDSLIKLGFKVFMLRVPVDSTLRVLEDSLLDFDEFGLLEQAKEHGVIYVEEPQLDLYQYDASHLDSNSAIIYSEFLARYFGNSISK